jgi:hypothetical protein
MDSAGLDYELIAIFCENDSEAAGTAEVENFLSSRAIGSFLTVTSVMDCGNVICHLKNVKELRMSLGEGIC